MRESRMFHLRKWAKKYVDSLPADHPGVTILEIAQWMVRKKHYELEDQKVIQICASELSHALTTHTTIDNQGREVRVWACIVIKDRGEEPKQAFLWKEVEKASYEFMLTSFHLRRSNIAFDVNKLHKDQDSYNENYLPEGKEPINLNFDFRDDESEGVAS